MMAELDGRGMGTMYIFNLQTVVVVLLGIEGKLGNGLDVGRSKRRARLEKRGQAGGTRDTTLGDPWNVIGRAMEEEMETRRNHYRSLVSFNGFSSTRLASSG